MRTINQTIDLLLSLRNKKENNTYAIKDTRIDLLRERLVKMKISYGVKSEIPYKDFEEYIINFI